LVPSSWGYQASSSYGELDASVFSLFLFGGSEQISVEDRITQFIRRAGNTVRFEQRCGQDDLNKSVKNAA
jgi:hypothetical protein